MKAVKIIETKFKAGCIAGLTLLFIAISPFNAGAQSVITTYAGGSPIQLSSSLSITQIGIGSPVSVVSDGAGGFYFTTSQRIYRAAAGGSLTLIAGNGTTSFSGDGGPAVFAGLNYPMGIALDGTGNLFIADSYRIRKVTAAGIITTVAGMGVAGSAGDGGPAIAAQINSSSIAADRDGNLFIAEYNRIRKVTLAGIITTVADKGTNGFSGFSYAGSIAVDQDGSLFIVDYSRIRKVTTAGIITTVAGTGTEGFSGDGGPATSAQLSQFPSSVTVDQDGNLLIGDNGRIRKVTPAGIITTVAGNGTDGFSGDGGPAVSAQLGNTVRVASDRAGNLFIADMGNNRIREITSAGLIITVAGNGSPAGDGSPAISAQFLNPSSVTVDRDGTLLIADTANSRIARIGASGIVSTVAGNGKYDSSGDKGDGRPAISAPVNYPTSLTVDAAGNVFVIADSGDGSGEGLIRQINTAGIINTISNGWYLFDYDGYAPVGEVCLAGIAVDADGNVFIATTFGQNIWKISPSGTKTRVAGSDVGKSSYSGDGGPATSALLSFPNGLAVDGDGNLFIADSNNNRIRKVSPAGIITTVAGNGVAGFGGDGGPATSAQLRYPEGVAVDANGNLFIADAHNNRIRKVTPAGIITTVAGDGTAGFGGDGGPADAAQLNYPTSVALDGAGNLFIADYYNNRVRKVFLDTTLALTGISPDSGGREKIVHVTLNGIHFDSTLSIRPIDGITVSDVTLVGSTSATATFTISASALAGLRDVVVTTSTETSSTVKFMVNPPPTVASLNPPVGIPGTSLPVILAGTGFGRGLSVDSGSGISVSNIIVTSATSAVATFTVASDAALGARSITITTLDGDSAPVMAFSVVLPFPDLAITSAHATGFGVGFTESYEIRVNNVGLIATTEAITITDVLPAGLSFVSGSGSAWSCATAGQTVTCSSPGPIGAGAASALSLNVDVSSAAVPGVTHIVSVATTGDLIPSNNSASDTTTVAPIPVPNFSITFFNNISGPAPVLSGQQSKLRLTLATPFPHDVSGSLAMGFTSNVAIPVDDPAVQFASGGRQTTFLIPANTTEARFGGNTSAGPIGFQAGTVAGTLSFSGTLQSGTLQTTIAPSASLASGLTIAKQRPVIQSLGTSTQNGFVVSINLFSTTREVSQFSLTFNTSSPVTLSCGSVSGCSASGSTLTFDVKSMFDAWFSNSTAFGSLSTLHLPLSISGTVHGSVLVRLQNSMGISLPSSFTLP